MICFNAHALYQSLGETEESRQTAYRELFRHELDIGIVDEIRRATHSNYALGNEVFAQQVELALGCKATAGRVGRPKKDES